MSTVPFIAHESALIYVPFELKAFRNQAIQMVTRAIVIFASEDVITIPILIVGVADGFVLRCDQC